VDRILYIFGGYDGSQRVNTFHAFSFAEKRWSPVLPSAHSSPPPTPRDRHVAVAFGNSIYIHASYKFLYCINKNDSRRSIEDRQKGSCPRNANFVFLLSILQILLSQGGFDGSARVSDFWAFDFSTMVSNS